MNLPERIELLSRLGEYMQAPGKEWARAQMLAVQRNPWFTPEHISLASKNIAEQFLDARKLKIWSQQYRLPLSQKKVGVVMAGNIPLVGFHDFLCGFISGHHINMKLSERDAVLLPHLVRKLAEWNPSVTDNIHFAEMLKGCDAYIATGSNNSARYFEQYFGKYPHIIRRNRTSVAVLDGTESAQELSKLGEDIFAYFGLGCRNVTALCIPRGYDFVPLMNALMVYEPFMNHNKYRNNYDYHLALYLLNKVPYLSNESVLMVENDLPFSAVSVLHYRYYANRIKMLEDLRASKDIQAVIGHDAAPFGTAQLPALDDYADGVDTMAFLCAL